MRPIRRIVIHHSATRDSETLSWEAIRQAHLARGWADVGYHYGVEMHRGACQVLVGRPLYYPGAHVTGHNADSIGLCVIGNLDEDKPHPRQIDRLLDLLRDLIEVFGFLPDRDTILGHRDLARTRCPGAHLDVDDVVRRLAEMVPN